MKVQSLLHTADAISTWVGKAFAWLIVALMLLVVIEVFKRYALNAPTAWVFDASNMLYGTLFMMVAPTPWPTTAMCAAISSTAA